MAPQPRLVEPIFKAEKVECPCGCKTFGQIARGTGHVKTCPSTCVKCRNKRNRRRGLAKQRTARKALGIATGPGSANEETWGDNVFSNEVKSGRIANPAATAFLRIEGQVFAHRADHGDRMRPCRAVLMPDEWGSEGLVMVRLSTWTDLVRPALEHFYGPEGESDA